jgi:hydrogenase maturation protease HycI
MPTPDPRHALKRALNKALEADPSRDPGTVVVLGVGSELRSDDAAGLRVTRGIARLRVPGVHALDGGPAPESCTGEIRRIAPSHLLIVDAADMAEPPGTVRLIDLENIAGASFGTHGLPLSVVADYLRRELGCRVAIIGIQPASLDFGESLSAPVAAAVDETVRCLAECLAAPARSRTQK